jgi:hypothetical protein
MLGMALCVAFLIWQKENAKRKIKSSQWTTPKIPRVTRHH